MTWYASQIMTIGHERIIDRIKKNPSIAEHSFRVTNPIRLDGHSNETRHSVPIDGLVFIRPICGPCQDDLDWHGSDYLPTQQFEAIDGVELSISPESITQRGAMIEASALIPEAVLRFAKKLNVDTGVPVAFYYCFCWGGDVEIEYAWVFDEAERVLICLTDDARGGEYRLLEMDTQTEATFDDDVLVRTLQTLSCELPTPYFEPHTRGFPWDQHRL